MKITDPTTGKEMEVFTSEEVENKTKEAAATASKKAVEDFQASNPDKSKELEDTKNKLVDAEARLKDAEDAGGDDEQKKRLRKERDDAKAAADAATTGFEKKLQEFRNEMVGDTKSEWLDKLSKGDADMRKKIELEFDNYKSGANSKKEVEDRMLKAYTLATGNKPQPNFLDGAAGGGNGSGYKPGEKKEVKANELAIGNVLGVSDKDREAAAAFKAGKI